MLMSVTRKMGLTLTAAVAIVVLGGAAFVAGRNSSEANSSGGQERAGALAAEGQHEDQSVSAEEPRIEGAEHVHAVTYGAGERLLLGAHGGLYTSADGGNSWTKVETTGAPAGDFMSLVSHPQQPGVLFAGGHGLGVVKSTDGGVTWVPSDEGIDGTDIHALTINQRQPEYLFAFSNGYGVYRSTDGGASWERLDDGPPNPGVRAFAYMAVETDMDRSMGSDNWGLLFAGTADGIYDSYSCFCGWRTTADDFAKTTVYTLATLHSDLRVMYAGTNDGLWKSDDEGKTWRRIDGPTGRVTAVAINPADSAKLTAVTETGVVFATADGGLNWERRN